MKRTEATPFFDRIISWSFDHPLKPFTRYFAATMVIVAIALIRAMIITSLVPWLLFIPAILGIALILGEGAGMYASVLAAVLAALTIGDPDLPWLLTGPQWAGSLLFVLVAAGAARFTGELRAAFRRVRRLNAELMERGSFLSGVLASSTDCIKVVDLDGRLSFMSEGGMKVMEISDFNTVKGCPWPDFWQDAGNTEAVNALERARRGETSHFVGKADTFLGTSKWWNVSVSPILGPDGKPDRILAVSRVTSAMMDAQEQQRLLNSELSHRLKNVLALVQSIANQTFRQAQSVEEVNIAFAARLAALGKATDVLTSTAWQSATLRDAVDAGLTSVDGMRDRIVLEGPAIKLDSQIALALTLAVHELTTNACKYGALSNDDGTIALNWKYKSGENGEDGRLNLTWQESGGPLVTPPTRKGFGSTMIERSLRSYFRGETSLIYDSAGVIFSIDAPLSKAAIASGA